MSMEAYAMRIRPIYVSASRSVDSSSKATREEVSIFRKLASELVWLKGGVLPM